MIGAFNVANDHVFAKVQPQMVRCEIDRAPVLFLYAAAGL